MIDPATTDPLAALYTPGGVVPLFLPLADRCLVRRLTANAMSKGGLHIPPSAMEKLNQGEVVAVGPAVEDERIQPAAVVLFGKYAGDEILLVDELFVVIREVDLFGIVPASDTMPDGGTP